MKEESHTSNNIREARDIVLKAHPRLSSGDRTRSRPVLFPYHGIFPPPFILSAQVAVLCPLQ